VTAGEARGFGQLLATRSVNYVWRNWTALVLAVVCWGVLWKLVSPGFDLTDLDPLVAVGGLFLTRYGLRMLTAAARGFRLGRREPHKPHDALPGPYRWCPPH
jgi:hypothetical protein